MKKGIIAGAGGGGSKGGSSRTPVEAVDNVESKSLAYILDLLGEGVIGGLKEGAKSVFLDDVPLANPDGSLNFNGVKIWERKGEQNQDPIEGFDDIETPRNVAVEVKATTPKTIQIDNDECDQVRIIMDFPRLSSTDKASGDINGATVEFQFQLAVGDGGFKPVIPVDHKSDIIKVSKKSSGKFQKEYFISLPKPGKNYRIKVVRLTADSTSDYLANKTILSSYGEIIFAKLSYPNSALVGIAIDSKEFGGNMPRRSYLVSGMYIRVPSNYDPVDNEYKGDWDGTFEYRISSNPAWILFDILVSDRYGLGEYVKEYMIDTGMLYQIGRYCDEEVSDGFGGKEKRFAINTVISSRQEAFKVINDIASVFRGMVFWAGGMINMRQDKPSDPVMLFSSANIIGRVTRKGSARKDRPTVAVVTYNDKDDLYKQNIEYVEDQDAIKDRGVVKTELLAFGCTSRGQAHRTGLWLLYTAKMETDVILFKAGIDCSALMPGDVVKLNDKYRSGKRNSGRIVSFTKNSIKLDQSVNLSNSGAFISFMSKEGKLIDRDVLEAAGERSVLTFKEPLKAHEEPVNLAVWMVTEPDLEPELVRVVSIKDTDEKGVFEITGVSHNPSKYQAIDNGATLIPSKTTVKDPTFVTPSNIKINETTYLSSPGNLSNKLIVSWQGRSTQYTIRYRRSDVVDNWAVVEVFDTQYEILNVQQDAKYDVEVFAISITGRKTNAIASTYAVLGKSNPPDAPKQLVAVGDYRQNVLTWIAPAAIDLEKINVYGSKTNKFETASLLASVPSTTFNHSGLEDNVTWFYWVRAVNKRGMLSPVNSNIGTQATTKEVMSFLKDKITETELSKDLLADINENAANLAAEKVNEDVKIQVDEVKKNVAESKDMANKAISDITKLSTSVDKEIADRKESVTALTNSTNSLSEKLTQEIKNRNDSVAAESQKRADDLVAESKSRVADIKKETDARLLGLQNEAKARSNALKEETRLRNEAIQTKSAELSKEILNEKVERGAAISASERKIQTKTDALAMRITNLSTATDANAAAIKKEEQARTTADKAEAKERQSLATQMRGDYDGTDVTKITSGLIFSEREARTTADKAEALQRRTLETRLGESLTAVNKSVESISTAQKAQGNDITAINTTLKNKADSSAVNSLNSKVEEQGKTLTSQGSAVTKLQNDLGVANTSIGKKADSSALSALESKVVQQGKDIVSQGSLVNSLQNNLNTTNANVNKKADSSTVSTLDSKVTQQGKDIASQGGLLNTLQNRINTTDSNVSKKADSSAVTALESKVTQQSKDLTSTSGNLVKLSNTVNNMTVGGTNLISVADSEIGTVREATNIGAVYNDVKYPAKNRVRNKTLINATKGIVVSIDKGYQFFVCSYDANSKYLGAARSFTWRQNDLIIPAFSGFISVVITKSDNSDITLNEVIKSRVKVEIGNVRTDWSMSPLDTASANDISNLQSANSEALSSLNNKVDKQGKDITAVSSQINSLKNSLNETNTNVSKKADSTALSSLDSKVVQQGKDISTISTNVTTLQNNLKMTNDNVSKKADSSALSTLDSKVVQQGKDITSSASEIATLKNNLKTTDANVSKKAESSALSALDNKVTQQGKDISSHGNSITELKNSTSAIKNDLDDVNLLARITTNGKQLVSNPNFNGGSNDVVVYNNANNGMALIATTKRQVDNPTSSSHEIVLTAKGTASPNFGGFIRNVQSKANAVFVTKYIIKLPVGWGLQAHANATGDGRIDKFVGNNTGTGKYETYYRITKCGSTGKFETFGHVSVYIADGGKTKAPTFAAPLVWYLAQIEVYETTDYASATPEVTNFMSSAKSSLDSLTNTTKSQSSQLTALQNSLNTTNSNVGKKADSSALSALDSKVTQQGKDITATNNSVTSLQSSLNGRITFVITSGGAGSGYSGRVFDNNGKVLASIGRSYGVVVFKKNTKGMVDVASSKTYDVYGNAVNATTLVNDIKALPYGTYVAITTSDEPNQNRLSILAAIELLGGTKETFTSFPYRGAYILVGRIGARGGDSIELASRSGNDSNAFVETSIEFVNGVLMNYGNSSGAASLASANASAISKLDNTVKQQGGNITSHSSQLTKLQNDLNITNNNVGKKADATALSALESKVTQQGKDISSVSSKATSLENSLKTTNDNVGKKADTTALNSLTSKVNTVEGKVNAATSSITTLSSKIDQVKSDLTDLIEVDLDLSKLDQNTYYPVTLHLNTLTRYYFKVFRTLGQFPTNNPSYATHGTKTFSTILEWNVSGDGWGTQAQNRIIQNFDFRFTNQSPVLMPGQLSNSSIEYVYLRGGSFYKLTKPKNCGHTIRTAAYTSNSQAVAPIAYNASLIPVSFGKGTSDAISNLSTKVTSIDGKLNTTASDVTNLKTTVGKKADSTALNSLTSTVTQHGKDISAHSSSLSQLTTKVNGNTTKIDQVSKSVSDVSKAQTETKNSMESQFKGQSAKIETLEKTVASGAGLSSTWMVKMAANAKGQKYAAGIALGIEGKNLQSQFLVQADRFALINTANGTTTTPFVIDGGVTYISAASIKNGSIDSAKFGDLQSNNYKANSTGWKLGKNGTLEMNGQTSGKGRLSITNNRIDVYDEKGVLRVRLGLL
ncbi:phage tail protein [Providencia manganoxydans]|uniref:phage tail tip fiber protein n=1 Tax=Providencia manganoxydans TaxID=2923283 RepID=UPI0034E48F70